MPEIAVNDCEQLDTVVRKRDSRSALSLQRHRQRKRDDGVAVGNRAVPVHALRPLVFDAVHAREFGRGPHDPLDHRARWEKLSASIAGAAELPQRSDR